MALTHGAYPFAQILVAIKARLVASFNIPTGFVKIVATDEYPVTRVDPLFLAIRCFAPSPIDPKTGQPFGDIGSGRLGRTVARLVRVYLHTRTGVDIYGDDTVALGGSTPSDTVETTPAPTIKHLLGEEYILNALDDYFPMDSTNSTMTIGPIHWTPFGQGSPPQRKALDGEGLVHSSLDFQVVYISAINKTDPAP